MPSITKANKKSILFITWDGPQTSYMEGLFMPIFHEVSKKTGMQFHVIQFTWANQQKIAEVRAAAEKLGIQYTAFPILRKPVPALGSLLTLYTFARKVKNYIKRHNIDIVMPRSTFPAALVNRLTLPNCKIIFDADGLPIEERVDFAGLKKNSLQYRWMKRIETEMLQKADHVITRSQKSIDIHTKTLGSVDRTKFTVVQNGRDVSFFEPVCNHCLQARKDLGVDAEELLLVYCGSLGAQYCWEEMISVYRLAKKIRSTRLLILTGNTEFAQEKIQPAESGDIIIKKVPFEEVPFWLNAADAALALRQPSFSMKGVAPIKLGEYLLMDLPVLASKGIGDTEDILAQFPECYLFDHSVAFDEQAEAIQNWLAAIKPQNNHIREKATQFFSLDAAAESYIQALKRIL